MKIRLKFRNKFHPATFEAGVTLSEVLSTASKTFNVGLSNVQLSLNAKDFFGVEESHRTLADLGIVSGDILYVNSLEDLDDIKKYIEIELSSRISNLMETFAVPHHTLASLISVALLLFASEKGLHALNPVDKELTESKEIVRLELAYETEPTVRLIFTVYSTGNLINIACGAQILGLRRQLILPIRDHLVLSAITACDTNVKPNLVFRNLQTLGIRMKDELIEPILVTIHSELGLPQRLLLYTLPLELLVRILMLLPLSALGKLMLTNSFMRRQITSCNPVWRMHLNQLNAKKQPLLDAALTRQQRQQQTQSQQATSAGTVTENTTTGVEATNGNPPDPGEAQTEGMEYNDSPSDSEVDAAASCPFYERFVARYRSLLIQRRCRGLSPSFV